MKPKDSWHSSSSSSSSSSSRRRENEGSDDREWMNKELSNREQIARHHLCIRNTVCHFQTLTFAVGKTGTYLSSSLPTGKLEPV